MIEHFANAVLRTIVTYNVVVRTIEYHQKEDTESILSNHIHNKREILEFRFSNRFFLLITCLKHCTYIVKNVCRK